MDSFPNFKFNHKIVSIYDGPQSGIPVKSYGYFNFPRASYFDWVFRYIIGPNPTFQWKIMAIWNFPGLPCLISSVSIYDRPQSGSQKLWLFQFS